MLYCIERRVRCDQIEEKSFYETIEVGWLLPFMKLGSPMS